MDPIPTINNIDNKASASLNDTFSRGWKDIKEEAAELSILCGAEIAAMIQSPTGELFTFGSPTEESVISKFQSDVADLGENSETTTRVETESYSIMCGGAMKKLEKEGEKSEKIWFDEEFKGMEDDLQETEDYRKKLEKVSEKSEKLWFDEELEGMKDDLQEMEDYSKAIETLRENVLQRIKNMEQAKPHPPPSSPSPPPPMVDTTTVQCTTTTPPPPPPQY